jgi:predicted HicB family RNase H-like nuclease
MPAHMSARPRRPSPGDLVQLATRVPKETWRAVRLDAIEREVTLERWVVEALREHLDRVGVRAAKAPEGGPRAA